MRIAVLSYIGAEEDILELFVRHTLTFADALTIVSTDSGQTRDILTHLQAEGLSFTLIDHHPEYHDQHEVLSGLLMDASANADWILPLDADEFVAGDICTALEQSEPVLRALPWKTYVPVEGDSLSEPDVLKRIRHRRTAEVPQFSKIVIPASLVSADTMITQGNHAVMVNGESMRGEVISDIALAHFPVRSCAQMEQKIARSWPAVARNPRRQPDEAFHWKLMHERYAGATLDVNALTDIALHYSSPADAHAPELVEDPVA